MSGAPAGNIIDLFGGPGGWEVGAQELGLDVLGIEWDDAACATRKAAGLRTLQADVAELDPLDFAPVVGLIASPPCQAWSMAGKGGGRRDKELVVRCAGDLAAGSDTRAVLRAECEDDRSILAVEPLRWALALRPSWCAIEQVPPVLELWSMFAQVLALCGYSTWAGILEAERYGVPQTRERAVLIARLDGPAVPPRPTHQRYVPGEPARHDVTLEGVVLPWVSMAEALGWDEGEIPSPAPTVTGGGGETGGVKVFASKGARDRVSRAVRLRMTRMPNSAERAGDEPAPTMAFGHDAASCRWVHERPAPTIVGTRRSKDGMLVGRQLPEGQGENIGGRNWLQGDDWPLSRPATTVAGDARIFQPGGHHEPGQQAKNAVRVTIEEAATLQTFPPDYPWQGSRTKQYEQVGNAVPPLLAKHILRAVTG